MDLYQKAAGVFEVSFQIKAVKSVLDRGSDVFFWYCLERGPSAAGRRAAGQSLQTSSSPEEVRANKNKYESGVRGSWVK